MHRHGLRLETEFEELRQTPELTTEWQALDAWLAASPDKTLALIAEMDDIAAPGQGPVLYSCPMLSEVTRPAGPEPSSAPHRHIAEHIQSGMMFSFTVARQGEVR
jgi:hypothetical protein